MIRRDIHQAAFDLSPARWATAQGRSLNATSMTWRPKHLIEGALDNRTPGKVTGWLRFYRPHKRWRERIFWITLDLDGDFHEDIRGMVLWLLSDDRFDRKKRERLCCPFFTFEIVAEREGGPLWLNLRGRKGVKAFINAELGVK